MTLFNFPPLPIIQWAVSGTVDQPNFPSGSQPPTPWLGTGYQAGHLPSALWFNKKMRTIGDHFIWGREGLSKIDGFVNNTEHQVSGSHRLFSSRNINSPGFFVNQEERYRLALTLWASTGFSELAKTNVDFFEYYNELWSAHYSNGLLPTYEKPEINVRNPGGFQIRRRNFGDNVLGNEPIMDPSRVPRMPSGEVSPFQAANYIFRNPVRLPRYHLVGHGAFRWGSSGNPAPAVTRGCIQNIGDTSVARNNATGGWLTTTGAKTVTLKSDFFDSGDDYLAFAKCEGQSATSARYTCTIINRDATAFEILLVDPATNQRLNTNTTNNYGSFSVMVMSKREVPVG